MKKSLFLLLLLFCATFTFAASGKDIRIAYFTTTPQMHCANCENTIKGNLRFEKGVKRIETNIPDQRITVTYDAKKTNVEKLIKGFKKFGYTAREVKKGEKTPRDPNEVCKNM